MQIFISAGEPSGDLHGANLMRAIRERWPDVEFVGFGGERMEAAGCRLLYPLCQLAVMWFARVLANAHVFLSLFSKADRFFKKEKPDAVILIDFPGFNWWMARRAHFHGIPVYYFVPPQLWGWAAWRVEKMRKWVDHVLCTLPFEEEWYHERGVSGHFVGHPYFDELQRRELDQNFLHAQSLSAGPIIAMLPGSRAQEVKRNFSSMLRAAEQVHAQQPDVRFLVACFKEAHSRMIHDQLGDRALPIEVHVGRTPEIIAAAHSCIAVSGSVSLELLYHLKPTVILYKVRKFELFVCNQFKTSRFITLVNLLAGKELFPEFLVDYCPAEKIAAQIKRWLNHPVAHHLATRELQELRDEVAKPGACERAAAYILNTLAAPTLTNEANTDEREAA